MLIGSMTCDWARAFWRHTDFHSWIVWFLGALRRRHAYCAAWSKTAPKQNQSFSSVTVITMFWSLLTVNVEPLWLSSYHKHGLVSVYFRIFRFGRVIHWVTMWLVVLVAQYLDPSYQALLLFTIRTVPIDSSRSQTSPSFAFPGPCSVWCTQQ